MGAGFEAVARIVDVTEQSVKAYTANVPRNQKKSGESNEYFCRALTRNPAVVLAPFVFSVQSHARGQSADGYPISGIIFSIKQQRIIGFMLIEGQKICLQNSFRQLSDAIVTSASRDHFLFPEQRH